MIMKKLVSENYSEFIALHEEEQQIESKLKKIAANVIADVKNKVVAVEKEEKKEPAKETEKEPQQKTEESVTQNTQNELNESLAVITIGAILAAPTVLKALGNFLKQLHAEKLGAGIVKFAEKFEGLFDTVFNWIAHLYLKIKNSGSGKKYTHEEREKTVAMIKSIAFVVLLVLSGKGVAEAGNEANLEIATVEAILMAFKIKETGTEQIEREKKNVIIELKKQKEEFKKIEDKKSPEFLQVCRQYAAKCLMNFYDKKQIKLPEKYGVNYFQNADINFINQFLQGVSSSGYNGKFVKTNEKLKNGLPIFKWERGEEGVVGDTRKSLTKKQ
jgi:hypothetical protein